MKLFQFKGYKTISFNSSMTFSKTKTNAANRDLKVRKMYIYLWVKTKQIYSIGETWIFKKSTEVLYPVIFLYITGNAICINSILYDHGCNLSRMFSFKGEWWNSFWRSHSTILIDFINYYVILFSKPSLFCHFVRCIELTRDVFIYSVSMINFYNITK